MAIRPDPKRWQIGVAGYGEIGRILAEDPRKQDRLKDLKIG